MSKHRVLVLHSDVAPDAPPDELDTLWQADSIAEALADRGHIISKAAWVKGEEPLRSLIAEHAPEAIFNLVEAVDGLGLLAVDVPKILDGIGVPYTGAGYDELVRAGNKPLAKQMLHDAGLPTPAWAVPPDWKGLHNGTRMIVKSALEDCSLGLDDGAIVSGLDAVRARHAYCIEKFGGHWFAEAYIEGREFNVAVFADENGEPSVLPLAEMMFHEWQSDRPRIVGWQAKWDDDSFESTRTQREFGADENEPALAQQIRALARDAWKTVGLTSYARVDIRVDGKGRPTVLELNPNPCLSPDAGFAAAAERVGMNYADLMERILFAALA